ncbi:MAG: metallophosphoesterase [bacterium]
MSTLRVLHISDLHLAGTYRAWYEALHKNTKSLSVHNIDALNALTEIIYNWRDHLDAILITGDIAVTGLKSDLQCAQEFLESPPLKAFDKPIILVPGNHDRYRNILGFPGNRFYSYLISYWNAGEGGVQCSLLPNENTPMLAIICCDFSLNNTSDSNTLRGIWGQGRVYKERLQNLVQHTKNTLKLYPSCAVIWMVHFAPKLEDYFSSLKFKKHLKLINSEKLIEQAEKAGVRYIFCGHTHLSKEYQIIESSVWVICAGTSTCTGQDEDTKIHLREIHIESGKVIKIRSRQLTYDQERQLFQL